MYDHTSFVMDSTTLTVIAVLIRLESTKANILDYLNTTGDKRNRISASTLHRNWEAIEYEIDCLSVSKQWRAARRELEKRRKVNG